MILEQLRRANVAAGLTHRGGRPSPSGVRLPVGLLLLVELEPGAIILSGLLVGRAIRLPLTATSRPHRSHRPRRGRRRGSRWYKPPSTPTARMPWPPTRGPSCHRGLRVGTRCPEPGEAIVRLGVLRVEPDDHVIIGDRLVVLVLGEPGVAAAAVGEDVLRIEPDGLGVIGDRLVVLLLGLPGVAAAVVGVGELGVEPDGLGIIGDGLVVLLLGLPGAAAVVVGVGVLGVEPDGLVAVGDRLVVLLL